MAGTQVTSPNQVTRYERKNIWQIIGFISVSILIFAYKLGIDGFGKYIPFYSTFVVCTTSVKHRRTTAGSNPRFQSRPKLLVTGYRHINSRTLAQSK